MHRAFWLAAGCPPQPHGAEGPLGQTALGGVGQGFPFSDPVIGAAPPAHMPLSSSVYAEMSL